VAYKRKLYKFRFEDPDLEGLEVVTRPVSLGKVLELGEEFEALQNGGANSEAVAKMADLFVSCMVSWTVEEEDGSPAPLPASGADLLAEDASLAMALMTEWSQRFVKVAPPLPESSSGGPASALEQSIPMEPRSPSRTSSGGRG
jgi:hypothetical protein